MPCVQVICGSLRNSLKLSSLCVAIKHSLPKQADCREGEEPNKTTVKLILASSKIFPLQCCFLKVLQKPWLRPVNSFSKFFSCDTMPNCRGFCGCVQHCQVPEFGRITQKVDFYRLLQQRAERGNDSEKFCFLFFSSMNIWKLEFSHTCILTLHLSSLIR